MLRGVGGLVLVLVGAASLTASEPSSGLLFLPRTSRRASETNCSHAMTVFGRNKGWLGPPRRPAFELRLVVGSSDPLYDIVESQEWKAETAPGTTGIAKLEAADDEPIGPPKPLSDVAVPIDGAAENAEKSPKKDESTPAFNHFSFGGLIGNGNGLGILELESKPLPIWTLDESNASHFHVGFGYAIRWLTGPFTTDLPPHLYTLQLDLGWAFKLDDKLTIDARITPTWNTDFEKATQIFRLPWQAVAVYQADTGCRWTAGVMDLDREDIQLLPVAGLTYAPPDGDIVIDLVFPRPKIARRITSTENDKVWFYVAGELGGGSWAINRTSGARDIITLRDLRLLVGLETTSGKRHASRLEAGWVFDRVVDYRSNLGDYRPSNTALFRWSADF